MFNNLLAEMARININKTLLANKLNMGYETIRAKFSGRTEWTRKEMVDIKNTFFPNLTLDYLFEKNDSTHEKN